MVKAEHVERVMSVVSAVAEIANPFAGVATAAAKEAIGRWLKRAEETGEEILKQELLKADSLEYLRRDPDGMYVRTARYIHAVRMGTAHTNLRILARLVIYGDGSRAIEADDFLSLAQIIESLRPNELVVLAAIIRECQRREQKQAIDVNGDIKRQVKEGLQGKFSEPEIESLFGSLLRTGFVYMTSGYGAGGWYVSPQLMKLERTVQFAEAVAAAKAA
jgi:hypothetical protein